MMVECEICGKELGLISHNHLKYKHNMTIEEYRNKFPDANLGFDWQNSERCRKISEGVSKARRGKADKKVKCEICGGMFSILGIEQHKTKIHGEKNYEAWNKGLTKKKDDRVKKYGERGSKTKRESKEWSDIARNNLGEYIEKGREAWNKGLTKETDERVRKYANKSKEGIRNIRKANAERPSGLELKFKEICEENKLPFKYVGMGDLIIGMKNPDFVHNNELKLIIEIFGDYWHDKEDEKERKEFFSEFGYKTLIFWGHEIDNLPEEEIVQKVRNFVKN